MFNHLASFLCEIIQKSVRFSNIQVLGLLNKVSERNEVPKGAGGIFLEQHTHVWVRWVGGD